MADNLELQQSINKLIAERNKMLEDGKELIKGQAKLYSQLMSAISGKDGEAALDSMLSKLKNTSEELKNMAENASDSSKKTSEAFNLTGEDIDRLFGKTETLSEYMKSSFPKAFAIGAAAASGFAQGFRNIIGLSKAIIGLFSSIVSGAYSVAKSILAIPFKIFDSLIEKAQAGGGGNELMQAYENVRKQFGSFKQETAKNVIGAAKSMQGALVNTGLSVWRVFGNLAERLEYVLKTATEMGPVFNIVGKEFMKHSEEMGAYQKGLGLTGEEMGGVANRAVMMGTTMVDQFKDITNYSLQLGEAFGLSSKEISRDVGKMIKDVKNFGSLSIKQMNEVSVYTKKLGIAFTELQGIIDKFDTFEGAAEASAKLSQAFGVNLNAFEMMKEQDPSKRMIELKKSFDLAGKSVENMSRQELALLADATGLKAETVKLGLSSKNAGVDVAKLGQASDKAQKSQLTQAEAMSKLGDAIERLVKTGETKFKGFFDAFLQGIDRGITSSPEFIKLMWDIRRALRETFMIGVELGKWIVHNFPGVLDLFQGFAAVIKPIPEFFRNLSANIKQFISGDLSLEGFMMNMNTAFKSFQDAETGPFAQISKGLEKFMTKIAQVIGVGIKFLIKNLAKGLREATEFLSNPKKYLDKAVTSAEAGGNFMLAILKPIIEAVKDKKMWEDLWHAFEDFAGVFWQQAKKVFHFIMDKIPTDFWLGVAAVFFAPVVGKTILGIGTTVVGTAISEVFKSVAKSAPKVAGEAAAGSSGVLSSFLGPLFGNPYVIAGAAVAALAVVGTGLSIGVEKFKKDVEAKVGKGDEALFGAGAAGIIQALSLGQITDKAAVDIGVNLGNLAKKIEEKVADIFGSSFAEDLRVYFFSTFKAVLDIGDFVRSIFKGDAKGALKAIGSFAMDLLGMMISSMKFIFLTLPQKAVGLIADLAGSLGDMFSSIFDPGLGGSASGPMTNVFFSKIEKWAGDVGLLLVNAFLDTVNNFFPKLISGLYRFVSGIFTGLLGFFPKLFSRFIGVIENSLKSFGIKETNPFMIFFKTTKEVFNDVGDLIIFSGKFLGEAASKMWAYIKGKFTGSSTTFEDLMLNLDVEKGFKEYQANIKKTAVKVIEAKNEALADAAKNAPTPVTLVAPSVQTSIANVEALSSQAEQVKNMQDAAEKLAAAISKGGIEKSFNTISEMVKKVQEMNTALETLTKNPIQIKTQLQELANKMGMGSNQAYEVKSNGVTINIDMTVTMLTDKVEEVIVKNKNSKIRKTFEDANMKDSTSINRNLGTPR